MSKISELLSQIKKLEIQTKDLVEGVESGAYNSKYRGGGIEFSEVREYIPGDDVKRIDWNVSARHNSLYVKEFVEENELNIYLILDLSASTNFGFMKSKLDLGFEVAVSLMFLALKNNDRLGLGIFTNQLEKFIPSKKGKRQLLKIIKELIEYKPKSKETDILKSLSTLKNKLKRKSIIYIISDFLSDDYQKPLKFLKLHHEIILINISDIKEKEIPEIGYAYIEDAETGEQILVNTSSKSFQNQYREIMEQKIIENQNNMKKIGIDMINLTNEESFDITINKYFRNKWRMKN
ncbi:DUF58 domain-containing protein [Nitrosopumilus sp.]|nr:DUF58 domain-containing protein [Nitrosopumilus sp.]MDB4840325.1 DUF58 domain-containing protein [Nitrosopumilus sp.]